MEPFVWDKHYTTGLESVDQQHHRLVELINKLGDSLVAGSTAPDELAEVFAELADYARYHFADEERLMLEAGIDGRHREAHHGHHAEFVEQVTTIWNMRHAMREPAEALHGFLCAWLAFHILGEDQSMARQIAAVRAGQSPASAYERELVALDNPTEALLSALHRLYHVLSAQNRDLAAANQLLEQRVAERTAGLAKANQELTELNSRLDALSNRDGLLGIANRRYFDRILEVEWRRAAREGKPLSLLMVDVDHFKQFNDRYGHQAGDDCLKAIARASSSALKRAGDLLARYGGEELVVILPDTPMTGALAVAEALRKAVAGQDIPHATSPVAAHVTVSVGVASLVPTAATEANALIAAADRALYRAKVTGRDRVATEESARVTG